MSITVEVVIQPFIIGNFTDVHSFPPFRYQADDLRVLEESVLIRFCSHPKVLIQEVTFVQIKGGRRRSFVKKLDLSSLALDELNTVEQNLERCVFNRSLLFVDHLGEIEKHLRPEKVESCRAEVRRVLHAFPRETAVVVENPVPLNVFRRLWSEAENCETLGAALCVRKRQHRHLKHNICLKEVCSFQLLHS